MQEQEEEQGQEEEQEEETNKIEQKEQTQLEKQCTNQGAGPREMHEVKENMKL